jgi:hypothetical protein
MEGILGKGDQFIVRNFPLIVNWSSHFPGRDVPSSAIEEPKDFLDESEAASHLGEETPW